jgi:ubiquinone/menaquinone biosynthesis C-methylase UbiE
VDIETLKHRLSEIEKISSDEWMSKLDARKKRELEFHDFVRDKSRVDQFDRQTYEKFFGNRKYYGATRLSTQYIDTWIAKHARGKIFLDYACGDGIVAIKAARALATLSIGIDISPVSVENAKKNAEMQGVQNKCCFQQADAEDTKLPDNSIDVIVCSGMLHHLDLSYAFPELRRILVPGGRILAIEALNYNPFINLYRHLTPAMRTEWEKDHILSLSDLVFARRFFHIGETRYWHITSILYPYAKSFLPVFELIDGFLTKIPLIRLMAWMFSFELIKGNSD